MSWKKGFDHQAHMESPQLVWFNITHTFSILWIISPLVASHGISSISLLALRVYSFGFYITIWQISMKYWWNIWMKNSDQYHPVPMTGWPKVANNGTTRGTYPTSSNIPFFHFVNLVILRYNMIRMTTTFAVPLFCPADLVGKSFRSQDWWQKTDDSSYLKTVAPNMGKLRPNIAPISNLCQTKYSPMWVK